LAISCILHEKAKNFIWKLVAVYGSAYEDRTAEFIDELHYFVELARASHDWGDFNLCRSVVDKSNGRINQEPADCFTDWVNRCGFIELSPSNRHFT
jgi:hypothetical protein